jgi:hypothetical protein
MRYMNAIFHFLPARAPPPADKALRTDPQLQSFSKSADSPATIFGDGITTNIRVGQAANLKSFKVLSFDRRYECTRPPRRFESNIMCMTIRGWWVASRTYILLHVRTVPQRPHGLSKPDPQSKPQPPRYVVDAAPFNQP